MSRILLMNLVVILISVCACGKAPTGIETQLSKEEAIQLVKQKYLSTDSSIAIYSLEEKLRANIEIHADYLLPDTIKVDYESWFFFVDLSYPSALWPRLCDYVFVNSLSGEIVSFREGWPPRDFSELDLIYPIRQASEPVTKEEAFDILMMQGLGPNPKSAVLASNSLLAKNDTLYVSDRSTYYSFDYDSWFFFIDIDYIIVDTFPRSCQYAFVNANNGFIQIYRDRQAPMNLSELDTVYYKWEIQNYIKPVLAFSDSNYSFGCRDIYVYVENNDQNAIVIVEADESQLSLSTELTQFDLSKENPGLKVSLDFYYYLPPNYRSMTGRYCNDVHGWISRPTKKWHGKSGIVKIAVSENNRATIELENVHFFDENNENEVILESSLLSDIPVRWYPG